MTPFLAVLGNSFITHSGYHTGPEVPGISWVVLVNQELSKSCLLCSGKFGVCPQIIPSIFNLQIINTDSSAMPIMPTHDELILTLII